MFTSKKLSLVIGLLVLVSLVLATCQPVATPITPVAQTVVVTEVVEGEPVEVVQVVTPTFTPEPEVPRTLVICLGQEPDSLYIWGTGTLAARQVLNAIFDGPIDQNTFVYQPVILEKLPSIPDGDAVINAVDVAAGDTVVNDAGDPMTLEFGIKVRPAGCRSSDCAIKYDGSSALQMDQMVVTSKLLPGLLWSDGTPLKASDSVFSFKLHMDPDTPTPEGRYTGEHTASYEAPNDVTTVWTGLPGFLDATYYLNGPETFTPLPEHILGQYSAAEIVELPKATRSPLGWGPYIIDEWTTGESITLHKNPNYFRASEGLPVFENMVYRIMGENANANIAALLAGECDVVDQTSGLKNPPPSCFSSCRVPARSTLPS